jgi:hypothetical protein
MSITYLSFRFPFAVAQGFDSPGQGLSADDFKLRHLGFWFFGEDCKTIPTFYLNNFKRKNGLIFVKDIRLVVK